MFATVFIVTTIANAGIVPIVNPSFEAVPLTDGASIGGAPFGWQQWQPDMYTWNPTSSNFAYIPDGQNVLELWYGGKVQQGINYQVQAGETYDFSVMVGDPIGYPYQSTGAVQLYAVDDWQNVWGGTYIYMGQAVFPVLDDGQWAQIGFSVTIDTASAAVGKYLALYVTSDPSSASPCLDNFSIIATPEPTTMGLLGLGAYILRCRKQ